MDARARHRAGCRYRTLEPGRPLLPARLQQRSLPEGVRCQEFRWLQNYRLGERIHEHRPHSRRQWNETEDCGLGSIAMRHQRAQDIRASRILPSERLRKLAEAKPHEGRASIPCFRPVIGEDEIKAVTAVMRSGWLTTGAKEREFEQKFAAFLGDDVEAIAVNSATAGLHLAAEACGIGPGDEVLVPTLTFTASASVI